MKCRICEKEIKKYHPELSDLKLESGEVVHLCESCVESFLKWQQCVFAKLYPTSYAKKRYGKNEGV